MTTTSLLVTLPSATDVAVNMVYWCCTPTPKGEASTVEICHLEHQEWEVRDVASEQGGRDEARELRVLAKSPPRRWRRRARRPRRRVRPPRRSQSGASHLHQVRAAVEGNERLLQRAPREVTVEETLQRRRNPPRPGED